MATAGQTTATGGRTWAISRGRGAMRRVSIPVAFTVNHIGAWGFESVTSNSSDLMAGLYDTDGTLLAQSSVSTAPYTTGSAQSATMLFSGAAAFPAGEYDLVVVSSGSIEGDRIEISGQNGTAGTPADLYDYPDGLYPTLPADYTGLVDTALARAWDIWIDYTEASAGIDGDMDADETGDDVFAANGAAGSNGVRLTLRDTDTGALAANLTGMIVSVRDASDSVAVLAQDNNASTDADGVLELASGAIGNVGDYVYVTVEKSDHTIVATYRVQVVDLNASTLSFEWPVHEPAGLSAIPGIGGPGMDTPSGTGRSLETPQTRVLFINSLVDNSTAGDPWPEMGAGVYQGSAEYCLRSYSDSMDQNIPAVVFPLVSGWVDARKNIPMQQGTPPRPGFMLVAGQFAPQPGLFFRGSRLHLNGASNVMMMHVRVYMGDDTEGLSVGSRDCIGSGYAGGLTSKIVLAHCDVAWSCDELMDFYFKHDEVQLVSCALINPLHETALNPLEDHGFGPQFGGATDSQAGVIATMRCLWANITDRAPFTNAEKFTQANDLHFNHGRPGGGAGYAVHITGQNATAAESANVLWTGFIRGPENNSSIVAVRTTATLPADSHGYLEGNAAHGWTVESQDDLLTSAVVGYQAGALIEDAYPADWGNDGVLHWHADPNEATTEEWMAYLDLFERTVGAQPGWRLPGIGKVSSVFDAMRATVNGNMPGPQFSDSVADEGGWFPVPEVGPIDPLSPGQHWHAPFPVTGRDDVLDGSATWGSEPWIPAPFRNTNLQLAGRTVLERFIMKQHWYVMTSATRPALPE